jgi:CO/xanthine dehydrogenase Mo-binding subunit
VIAAHAALLARKSGRPVKLIYDRAEDIAATTKRHPGIIRHKTGVMEDGQIVASEIDILLDGGAYITLSPVVLSRAAIHAPGPYACPNTRITARVVRTNTPPNGAFRGFGAPQVTFAYEMQIEKIAAELRIDPLEVRRRNMLREGDVTATGQTLKWSVGSREVLDLVIERSDFERRRMELSKQPSTSRTRRGIGLSFFFHGAGFTGSGEAKMKAKAGVERTEDGKARILAGSAEIGQGARTTLCQIVADELGLNYEDVEIVDPDTSLVPDSGPTVASRTCMVVGRVLQLAARELKEKGLRRAFVSYESPPGIAWDDETYSGDAYPAYSWGAEVAEVEIDLDTCEIRVIKITTAQDVGRAIHPLIVEGQIEGGTLQAVGYGLFEDVLWENGRVVNNRLTNYIIPTSLDAPEIETILVEKEYPHGPFGAKGIGELPMDGAAPAIAAAVFNATGAFVPEIPITPERLMGTLYRL